MKTLLSMMVAVLFVAGTASMVRADGAELFGKKCAACHGKDGTGDTSMGKKLGIKDFTDAKVQAGATDAQWQKTILEGIKSPEGKTLMPPAKVTPEEAKELVKVCRGFKK